MLDQCIEIIKAIRNNTIEKKAYLDVKEMVESVKTYTKGNPTKEIKKLH